MYTYSGTIGVDSSGTAGTDSTDQKKGEIMIGDSQEQWLEHPPPPNHGSLMTGLSVTPYLCSSGGGRGISQV